MAQRTLDKSLNVKGISTGAETRAGAEAMHFAQLLREIAQERNKEAFVELFEHFAPRVKSFLMKGGTAEDVADELAQETMLTVWNKADSYDPAQASPSTWIFTIARNRKIDALRKTGRFEVAPADPELLESEESSSAKTIRTQETELMAEALKDLPDEQANLLRQSFFEDKTHAEIAKATGLPLGTVKSRIRLALDRLRRNNKVRELWQ